MIFVEITKAGSNNRVHYPNHGDITMNIYSSIVVPIGEILSYFKYNI